MAMTPANVPTAVATKAPTWAAAGPSGHGLMIKPLDFRRVRAHIYVIGNANEWSFCYDASLY